MKQFFLIAVVLFQVDSFAQTGTTTLNFDYTVMKVEGDLNNDTIADSIVVTQDTANEHAPYQLQIFFRDLKGRATLTAVSTKIIEPQYSNGREGYRTGNSFSDITITKGILSVNVQLLRGHFEHTFRFQNGNFELIGFSMAQSNGLGEMMTIDFNLSTGNRIEKTQRYDTDQAGRTITKNIMIRPLPKLQDIIPMKNKYY